LLTALAVLETFSELEQFAFHPVHPAILLFSPIFETRFVYNFIVAQNTCSYQKWFLTRLKKEICRAAPQNAYS
jgi:hypothetical protein